MEQAPKLGFGCSGAWGDPRAFSETKAIDLIHQALDHGIMHFDTGSFYAHGHAETRLGKALVAYGTMKKRPTLSSKTGTRFGIDGKLVKDFTSATIIADVETSLRRLGIDTLDILYLHGPNKHELTSSLNTLTQLKQQNRIKHIGICTNNSIADIAASIPEVDVLMTSFSLFDRRHFPAIQLAKENGKKTVTFAAMAQGIHKHGLFFPKSRADIWYLARIWKNNRTKLQQYENAPWLHEIENWTPAELTLAYALAQSEIDIVMTTTTRSKNLQNNLKTAQRTLSDDMYQKLENLSNVVI